MVVYYVTGTSTGLGKAIAEEVLNEGSIVVGLGRRHTIEHEQYSPVYLDLKDLDQTDHYDFQIPKGSGSVEKVVLVNNAGVIEPVKHLGRTNKDEIRDHFHVNLVAPMVLMNNFLGIFGTEEMEKVILNVTSGAAERPMDGWSCYCAGKAGLNMATQVVNEENRLENRNCRIYALAPGIVDTPMQDTIREANENEFSRLDDFKAFKKSGMLIEPNVVAKQFVKAVNHPESPLNVIDRLN